MKKLVAGAVFLAVALLVFGHGNEKRTASVVVKGKKIAVDYFSPHLDGRDLLALIKPGMEWRMGADAATTLNTEADLTVGSVTVPKGTYTLVAKNIGPDQWSLIFSSDTAVRGTRRDAAKDVATVPMTSGKTAESVEHMNIELKPSGASGAGFTLTWGMTSLAVNFTVAG